MKAIPSLLFTIILCCITIIAPAQQSGAPKDYLDIPGPVTLDKVAYHFTWSSHPTEYMYKQEYIAKGDNVERFKTMIMVDVIVGNTSPKEFISAKIGELKTMQKTNPMVQYEMFQNNGEYMLDFLVSQNDAAGNAEIVERNVYRYKVFTAKSGEKGTMLFAVSTRSYGSNIEPFLKQLKAKRNDLITLVGQFKLPELTIKR